MALVMTFALAYAIEHFFESVELKIHSSKFIISRFPRSIKTVRQRDSETSFSQRLWSVGRFATTPQSVISSESPSVIYSTCLSLLKRISF